MNFDWSYFWTNLFTPSQQFLDGLELTIVISVASMISALIVGLIIAVFGRSKILPLQIFASLYIWILRGTPLLVQLVIVYTGFAAAGLFTFHDGNVFGIIIKAAVQASIVTLTLHESAYISEIVRSGLESVDSGQEEAARSLGMTPLGTLWWVVIPQAVRVMVPPLGNEFNALMKNTSILSIIGVTEMFQAGMLMSASTFRVFETFIIVALYYLALTTIWTFAQAAIENKLNALVGLPKGVSILGRLFGLRKGNSADVAEGADVIDPVLVGGETA